MQRSVIVNFAQPVPLWLIIASCVALVAVFVVGILVVKNHPKAKRGDKI